MIIHGVDWNSVDFYLCMDFLILGLILLFYQTCCLLQVLPCLHQFCAIPVFIASFPFFLIYFLFVFIMLIFLVPRF